MKGYKEIIKKLKAIKKQGYIKTHRKGKAGIGKTLEDLLGIKENNIPGPNAAKMEIKSARKISTNMLTLFTKAPLPRAVNSKLLRRFGYRNTKTRGRKILHTTVDTLKFNSVKSKQCFKIRIAKNKVFLIKFRNEEVAYWDKATLQNSFEKKLPKLLYVLADTMGNGKNEEFWFREAWQLHGFDFRSFVNLLKKGVIVVDVRIGQYVNGKIHDHGTGFRIFPANLDMCFKYRTRIF